MYSVFQRDWLESWNLWRMMMGWWMVFFFWGGEMSIWGCNDILKTFFGWTYQLAEALVGWLWCNFPSLHLNRRCYSHHHDIQGYLKLPANISKRCEAGFLQRSWTPVSHKAGPIPFPSGIQWNVSLRSKTEPRLARCHPWCQRIRSSKTIPRCSIKRPQPSSHPQMVVKSKGSLSPKMAEQIRLRIYNKLPR